MYPMKLNDIAPDKLYAIPEAAAALGLNNGQLRGKLRAGVIGTVRDGAERKIVGAALIRYLTHKMRDSRLVR